MWLFITYFLTFTSLFFPCHPRFTIIPTFPFLMHPDISHNSVVLLLSMYNFFYIFLLLQISVPPVFKKKFYDMESNIGSPVKFECEIEETPNVTFKWFKSGSEIKQSDKFRIISWQSTSSLELLNPTKAEIGEYSCCASNKHGSDTCSANLNITGE